LGAPAFMRGRSASALRKDPRSNFSGFSRGYAVVAKETRNKFHHSPEADAVPRTISFHQSAETPASGTKRDEQELANSRPPLLHHQIAVLKIKGALT
jgi:hypothetical protein